MISRNSSYIKVPKYCHTRVSLEVYRTQLRRWGYRAYRPQHNIQMPSLTCIEISDVELETQS